MEELSQRWDSFLAKLRERYIEVIAQSEGPLNDIIANLQFDNVVIHNVRNGLHNQTVIQLTRKAEEGWGKMEVEMAKQLKLFGSGKESERRKLDEFRQWINTEFMKFEIGLYARGARKILENVKKHIDENKLHRCTQCAAELPINVYSFMAVNLKCESCGSVNTYQPDDRIRALEYYVLNHLADEHAMEAKLKKDMKEYYTKYYGYLMETVPDKRRFYERDLKERLTNPMFSMT